MTIYIDSENRCHTKYKPGFTEVETGFFDDACEYLVESFKLTRTEKGETFEPCKDILIALAVQNQFEEDQESNLMELAALIDEIYNEDLEVIENV